MPKHLTENDKGAANGVASLGGTGTIPASQIPSGVGVDSASGKIVDNTNPNNPVFNENTYVEESTILAGSSSGLWITRTLGLSYANCDVEMKVYKYADNTINTFGVREFGSTVPKFFPIRRQCTHMEVRADALGRIEIQADNNNIIFEVTGKKEVL